MQLNLIKSITLTRGKLMFAKDYYGFLATMVDQATSDTFCVVAFGTDRM
jgi:hypothetical protein